MQRLFYGRNYTASDPVSGVVVSSRAPFVPDSTAYRYDAQNFPYIRMAVKPNPARVPVPMTAPRFQHDDDGREMAVNDEEAPSLPVTIVTRIARRNSGAPWKDMGDIAEQRQRLAVRCGSFLYIAERPHGKPMTVKRLAGKDRKTVLQRQTNIIAPNPDMTTADGSGRIAYTSGGLQTQHLFAGSWRYSPS